MSSKKKRVELDGETTCPECGHLVPASRAGSECCSDECELKHLRKEVRDKDLRIEQLRRKKGPIQCLGQVKWATCLQEFYLQETYDAKRRANQLRKLGWICTATSIGEVPVMDSGKIKLIAKVTILMAWPGDASIKDSVPPPGKFIDGLRRNDK